MPPPDDCPVEPAFDPFSAEYQADPYQVLAQVRSSGEPVFYAPSLDYYVVTRHHDIERVFMDTDTFSAAPAQMPLVALDPEVGQILLDGGHRPQPSMVSLDEPAHQRLRGPAARAFTPKRVAEMEPVIRQLTRDLLDDVGDADAFDLVAALTFPASRQHDLQPDGCPAGGLGPDEAVVRIACRVGLGQAGTRRAVADRIGDGRVPSLPA